MPCYAVITADIVGSTSLSPKQLRKLIALINLIMHGNKLEFYRGDSFQAYLKNPKTALELVFRLRVAARSFGLMYDVRVSIGIGTVQTPVRSLKTASGEAFVLSGRAFDKLNKDQRLVIESASDQANIAFRSIAYYADFVAANLTIKQAIVVAELLNGATQTYIAKKIRKAQATVNKHAQAAHWSAIEKLIGEYQLAITQFNFL